MILTYDLYPATSLAFIYYAHLADVGVQPDSLPSAAVAIMPPPVAISIEVIATSSSTDLGMEPSTRVPPTSEPSLMFSFEGAGSSTGNVSEESPLSEFAPITTIIVILGGPPSKISKSARLLLQLLALHIMVVLSVETSPTIVMPPPIAPAPTLVSAST